MLYIPDFEKELSFDLFEFACFLKKHEKRKDLSAYYCLNNCLRKGSRLSLIKKKGFIVGFVLYSILFSSNEKLEVDEDNFHETFLEDDDIASLTLDYVFILPKFRGEGYMINCIEMIAFSLESKLYGLIKEFYVASEPINEKGDKISNFLLYCIENFFTPDDEEFTPNLNLVKIHNEIDYYEV
jgi:hypothetical protein